jgi:hypothetical protein
MKKSEWQALVTREVDGATDGLFPWERVSEADWEAGWLRRRTADEFAADLLEEILDAGERIDQAEAN